MTHMFNTSSDASRGCVKASVFPMRWSGGLAWEKTHQKKMRGVNPEKAVGGYMLRNLQKGPNFATALCVFLVFFSILASNIQEGERGKRAS